MLVHLASFLFAHGVDFLPFYPLVLVLAQRNRVEQSPHFRRRLKDLVLAILAFHNQAEITQGLGGLFGNDVIFSSLPFLRPGGKHPLEQWDGLLVF